MEAETGWCAAQGSEGACYSRERHGCLNRERVLLEPVTLLLGLDNDTLYTCHKDIVTITSFERE